LSLTTPVVGTDPGSRAGPQVSNGKTVDILYILVNVQLCNTIYTSPRGNCTIPPISALPFSPKTQSSSGFLD